MGADYAECTDKCWKPVKCTVCEREKAPVGRDVAAVMHGSYCTSDECEGYRQDPFPPHFWSRGEFLECTTGVRDED
jgi:hypothetical protein